jgi:hypothetical protein
MWRGGGASRVGNRSRLSRRLISPSVLLRMRLRGVREKRSSLRLLCFVCRGVGGGVTHLLSTAGLGRRVCCLLCSSTGLRVCRSKPLARRSRIVANSNPRMQREHCARTRSGSAQLALVGEAAAPFALLCSLLCSLASIAGRFTTEGNSPTHCSGHVQEAYGETRTSLLDSGLAQADARGPSRNASNPQHYQLLPRHAVGSARHRGVYSASTASPLQGLRPLVLAPRSRSRSSRLSCAALSSTKRSIRRA